MIHTSHNSKSTNGPSVRRCENQLTDNRPPAIRANEFFPRHLSRRYGFTFVEITISAMVLITVMTVSTSLCFKIDGIWKNIRHRRVAVCELANHMDRITRLDLDAATKAINELSASNEIQQTLRNVALSGTIETDELGHLIELKIDWQQSNNGPPLVLSGWLIKSDRSAAETSEESKKENDE